MTLAHAAAGAAIGSRIRSRRTALLACVGAHSLLDLPGHDDLDEAREGVLTLATMALTARMFGVRSREFWCGFACSMPDIEHVVLRGKARASIRAIASPSCTTRSRGRARAFARRSPSGSSPSP